MRLLKNRHCVLATIVFLASTSVPSLALAQNRDLINRLNRLENEIQTLNEAAFRGDKNTTFTREGIQNQAQGTINHTSTSQTAQIEVRLSALEQQIRDLTGKIEEVGYTANQMDAKAEKFIADANLRFQDIENKLMDQETALDERKARAALQRVEVTDPKPDPVTLGQIRPTNDEVTAGTFSNDDAMVSYEQAFALLRQGQYSLAETAFKDFLSDHKGHELSANAQYWLSETYYVRGDYTNAARGFAQGYKAYPKSPKIADNLLKLALSLAGLDKKDDACVTLSQLAKDVPDAPAAVQSRAAQEKEKLGCE